MLDRPLKCYLARSPPVDPCVGRDEPELVRSRQNVVIAELRPTQCTVGQSGHTLRVGFPSLGPIIVPKDVSKRQKLVSYLELSTAG
jgi:hypothetical protein